ncbi:MAG: MFS transporter [Oscillospiraceae bacterium]|nr:MFS transporter [Oscillospiraceae bacterium]
MLLVLGFLCYYLFCVITGEQINLLTTTLIEETGWTITAVTNTMTYGSLLAVVMIFVINTLFMKFNSKILMVGTTFVVAGMIALMGLSSVTLSMATFIIAWFILRVVIVILQHGTNLMCTNWWSKNRGKALGIATIGAPAASATFVAITTAGTTAGMRFSGLYYVFAGVIVVIGILMAIFYKDNPEDCGLYPDGALTPPPAEKEMKEGSTMTAKEVLTRGDSWLVIVSFGILYFGITCITAYFATVMIFKGVATSTYLVALSVGAIIGVPISFLLGVIDDKWGTPIASIVMGIFYIIGFLGMVLTDSDSTIATIMMATIGYAAITGGCPNLNPSINTYVFGRKNYLAASRIVMAAQGVIAAFANMYMGAFINAGNPNGAYLGLCGAVVVAIILLAILARKPACDSEEAVAARAAAEKA